MISVNTNLKANSSYGEISKAPKKSNENGTIDNSEKDKQISELQKQIEKLQKSKQDMTEKSLKKDESQAQIESDVKSLDEQIAELNKEISTIRAEEQQDIAKASDSSKKDDSSKTQNKTESETGKQGLNDNDMANLLSSKAGLSKIKISYDQDTKNKGEANVLNYEIEEDRSRGVDTSEKQKRVDEINDLHGNITKDASKELEKAKNDKKLKHGTKNIETYKKTDEFYENKDNKNKINAEV